jgi:hypothetical protein
VYIHSNIIRNSSLNGIVLRNTTNSAVGSNIIEDCTTGVLTDNCVNSDISNNRIVESSLYGIWISSSSVNTGIFNNIINRTFDNAIHITGSSTFTDIISNKIIDASYNSTAGRYVRPLGVNDGTIVSNSFVTTTGTTPTAFAIAPSGTSARWKVEGNWWNIDTSPILFYNNSTGICTNTISYGTPESVITAPPGSTAMDINGGLFYVKQSGTGNTGWVAK